jgi:large subunit ribosomal protein L7/L12
MAITKDDVVEYLKGITLLEASELVKELEEVFGVSAAAAAAPMAMAAAAGGDAAPAAEEIKTKLTEAGATVEVK